MAKGEYKLEGLTDKEHRAALTAVKLVRGDTIKNAYFEGYADGYHDALGLYRGYRVEGDAAAWERSQAKALTTAHRIEVPEGK